MKQEIHPKALTGAKLKSIDKRGNFVFSTDDGWYSINPNMLVGISDRDVYATGKLVRFTKNGKDKYQWVEDVEENPVEQPLKPVKMGNLDKGIGIGRSLVNKLLK